MTGPHPRSARSKLLTAERLVDRFGRPRAGELVFTNGVFDIMHRGHAVYLSRARSLGDALVVAVNTDASARRLGKGPDRPLNAESDRALLVAALECVDAVCLFDEDTPEKLIGDLLPDVLVKGGDYTPDQVAGRRAVERAGGRVEIMDFVEGYSTTDLIRRIRASS
ncbi:MAG: D-glycero-beta-D-manno-heptose 1-phosphate adenylyltransferase [Longimicrobiales bacterium]|nr:D-glycero-beta-D-manno-heptose 1-phosphate adenylyltransferase [Longimicrobiales bacterium]